MTTVLLTGFEPFGGDAANPTADLLPLVERAWERPERLVTAVLPTEFDGSTRALEALLDEHRPALAVSLGLAGGRTEITPERVAVNIDDARIPDNAGARPIDVAIADDGPVAYFSGLPIKSIVAALDTAGIPASVSSTAGTFVCNHVFYLLAHRAASTPVLRTGFIHVPWSDETAPAGSPALPLADLARGIRLALETSLDRVTDERRPGGSIH
ncbi:pyroglutamyl-peptidase I [Agromyces atrinae]|uniref:Pyrrolidone-carboxylate peptidase n=1 Tax=Agromyces atrinae TaxID=592376 RepID=A0A4Q2M5T6_9MICO|nr:pyroglutamyl-peptidase I [Agromyces atrinae]NYD65774.1 pyroglutamyl-peptidase [Agromyces atrinae]RXZ85563.1 pyroglutamyl-peptidase I [Agromyces atrinae]